MQLGARRIAAHAERQLRALVQQVEQRQAIRLGQRHQIDLEVQLRGRVQRRDRKIEGIGFQVGDHLAVHGLHAAAGQLLDAERDRIGRGKRAVRQRDFHRGFAVEHGDGRLAARRRGVDLRVAVGGEAGVAVDVRAADVVRAGASGFDRQVAADGGERAKSTVAAESLPLMLDVTRGRETAQVDGRRGGVAADADVTARGPRAQVDGRRGRVAVDVDVDAARS